jgi:hypothetical protein
MSLIRTIIVLEENIVSFHLWDTNDSFMEEKDDIRLWSNTHDESKLLWRNIWDSYFE